MAWDFVVIAVEMAQTQSCEMCDETPSQISWKASEKASPREIRYQNAEWKSNIYKITVPRVRELRNLIWFSAIQAFSLTRT